MAFLRDWTSGGIRLLLGRVRALARSPAHRFAAFISYSHAADGRLAPALRDGLHRFAKPWYRRRAVRVFRDDDTLAVSPALWPSIEAALAGSEFFVLLASPDAAASYWVDREVAYWLAHRSSANLLIVLTGGAVEWDRTAGAVDRERTDALPPSLLPSLRIEPRLVDLRWAATADHVSLDHPRFRAAIADLAATLRHREKDDLIGEDVREHRRTLRLARAVAAALITLTVATTAGALVARQQRDQAQVESGVALSRQLAAEAFASRDGTLSDSLLLSVESGRSSDTFESRSSLVAGLQSNPRLVSVVHRPEPTGALAFLPDGSLLLSGDYDTISVVDPRSNRLLHQARTTSRVGDSQFAGPAGSTLVEGHAVWSTSTGRRLFDLAPVTPMVYAAAYSPDGSLLAVGSGSGPFLVSAHTGQALGGFVTGGDASALRGLAFSPDGTMLGGGTVDGTVFLWDVRTRRQLGRPLLIGPAPQPGLAIQGMAFSADGSVVAAVDYFDGIAAFWDAQTGQRLAQASLPRIVIRSSAVSPDGRLLALGAEDGSVVLWDMQRQVVAGQVSASSETGEIDDLAFSPDGRLLAAGGLQGSVAVWDLGRRQRLGRVIAGHDGAVAAVAFSPDRSILASASADGVIRFRDPRSQAAIGPPMMDPSGRLTSMAFGAAGRLLATGSGDGTASLWDLPGHRLAVRLATGRRSPVTAVAFSPDGSVLVAGTADGRMRAWDVASRRWLGPLLAASAGIVTSVAFSADGRLLASGGGDGVIRLWDGQSLRPLGRAPGAMVTSLSFSPDGATLVSGGVDGSIRFWDTAGLRQTASRQTGRPVTAVAFAHSGGMVASGGDDGAVTLWNAGRRQPLGGTMILQSEGVTSLAFSAGDTRLASGSADQSIAVWDTDPASWQRQACAVAGRNLSAAEWDAFVGADHPYHRTCPEFPRGGA